MTSSTRDEVLLHRHLVVKGRVVGQVSHLGADFVGVVDHVEPIDAHASGRGKQVAGEHAQGRRLPGSVQAEEPDDLTLGDGKGQGADCFSVPVKLG